MKPKRLLLVDDEPELLEMLRFSLESFGGFVVRTESDPTKALQTAASFEPDLILLDVMMPGMDGVEVAEILSGRRTEEEDAERSHMHSTAALHAAQRRTSSIPVAFLSVLVEGNYAHPTTGRVYIDKSCTIRDLIGQINGMFHDMEESNALPRSGPPVVLPG